MFRRAALVAVLCLSTLSLTACKTTEEKIAEHYANAVALHEEGDDARALVELRNVFKLDGRHKEARLLVADIEEARGNLQSAYGNYLRLVEQYPENLEGRRALARLALEVNNWDEVERHGQVAIDLAPEDLLVRAIKANLDYRAALMEGTDADRVAALEAARAVVEADADAPLARRLLIDDLVRREDWEGALAEIDAAIAQDPLDRRLYTIRLGALEQLGREAEVEAQLREMLDLFPEDASIGQMLVRWYVSRQRLDEAEAYLRSRMEAEETGVEARTQFVNFLVQLRGVEAALDALDALVAEAETTESAELFRSMRATLRFDTGDREAGISELEDILAEAEPSDQTRQIKIALARMYLATDNAVGARALVEEVLAEDSTEVDALKLKAEWLIEDDKVGDALVDLRRALDQAPRDPGIATLMARAHQRAGDRDLMGEMLSNAVAYSGSAPAEAVRYATFLIEEGDLLPAEDVLREALRLQPENLGLLRTLGDVYARMADWPRLESAIAALERIGTPAARGIANDLTARLLAGQNRTEELDSFLEGLAQGGPEGLNAELALIRRRIAEGDLEGARTFLDEALAKRPDSPALRFVEAGLLVSEGDVDAAKTAFRDLVAEDPQREYAWLALIRLHATTGDQAAADAALEEALAALPEAANLLWARAGQLEAAGDIAGAIEIYERLYARNSDSVVVANNLASLISSFDDTPESLERAYRIARRLRGTEVPAFQDTYGWIAYRLGNYEEAAEYLEPAAAALPDQPLVRYHLAEVHAALGRTDAALAEYRAARALIEEDGAAPPYLDRLTAQIEALENPGDPAADGAGAPD